MRNFLKTTLYVTVFAVAGVLFQISCSNSDDSNLINSTDKLVFTQLNQDGQSIWTCDGDGSNLSQIPISLPAGMQLNMTNGNATPKLSADNTKVYFVVNDLTGTFIEGKIYSCNIDGSNLQMIVNPPTPTTLSIGDRN